MNMPKILFLILLCISLSAYGMEEAKLKVPLSGQEKHIYVGLGFHLGYFSPAAINEYIADAVSGYILFGTSDLFVNMGGKVCVTGRINHIFDVGIFVEYSWGPKIILVDVGDDLYFSFTKLSPGLTAKVHVPMGSGRHSFFFAPALTFNKLKFEEYGSKALGGKAQVGFSLNFGGFNMQPFMAYDHAKGVDKSTGYTDFEMNASSLQLGVELHF